MRIDIMTLFPDMFDRVFDQSIIGRAKDKGLLELHCHQIREYTKNKQMQVDDYPYGGGMGMVMFPQPIADCFRAVCEQAGARPHLIYMSPQGKTFRQSTAKRLAKKEHIIILCGHYEGVDQRIIDEIIDEEISIGDYVLTGGELPALVLADSISRMLPGVLANDEAMEKESHYSGLLEYPQYTEPRNFEGHEVPEILYSGNHGKIDRYRYLQALKMTKIHRPDLFEKLELNEKDLMDLEELN